MNKMNLPIKEQLAYEETFSCVQCGYCLPVCPTYLTFGKETHSPRGRINLVKLAAEGKIMMDELAEPIDLCLGCRACETACPTNVQYGKILDSAVVFLENNRKMQRKKSEQLMRKAVFKQALPNKTVTRAMGKGLYFLQKTKLTNLARKTKLLSFLPESLTTMERITPAVALPKKRVDKVQSLATPKPVIGFFPGCVMDTVFAEINDAAIRLLEASGCEVVTIKEQGCCGALQQHAGEKELAIELAKKNIQAFEKYQFDYIVNAIGGCGAALVEYHHYFDEQDAWHQRAKSFAEKCKDVSVILAERELPSMQAINRRIVYQPSCHLTNVQQVVEAPLKLLKMIPGIDYRPVKDQNLCCGSAGIYNMIHHEASMQILDHKMENVKAGQPQIIVTTNPGCHLQMLVGVEREGLQDQVKVVHLVQLLAASCGIV